MTSKSLRGGYGRVFISKMECPRCSVQDEGSKMGGSSSELAVIVYDLYGAR